MSLLVRTLRAEARTQCALTAKQSHGALLRDVGSEHAVLPFALSADCSSLRLIGAILRHFGVRHHLCGLTEQSGLTTTGYCWCRYPGCAIVDLTTHGLRGKGHAVVSC